MELLLLTGLFLPLFGSLFTVAFNQILPRRLIELVGPGVIFLSFLCFLSLLYSFNQGVQVVDTTLFTWIPVAGLKTDFSLHLDHLSLLMTLIISGIGFLICAYSVGYMDHDKDLARYFAEMNFFIFSMLLLVLGANLLVFFVGWEGVGVASYLLIGYWYQRPAAAKAAKKAFVVNRIGDFGLLLGIFLTYALFGTSDMQEVGQRVGKEFIIGAPVITILSLLYFFGATGKSAQIPLHTWLPDAMEGPTPVSALIHAATMVTAGVYLVVRMHPVFQMAPFTMELVAITGAVTALFAALCATSQTDVKRVLAYSTLSQLGLMFLATGVGAYFAAMFHLTTHAFVKALLFLSAGNVIHMLHGTTEMAKMGGLAKLFSKTNALFLLGVLAMAGVPPLAIFFSKDLILEEVAHYKLLYFAAATVSLLTAFYLTRAYILTFKGPCLVEPATLKTAKEAPRVMLAPVAALGLLTLFGGFLGFARHEPPILMNFLEHDSLAFASNELASGFHLSLGIWISIAIAATGIALGCYFYRSSLAFFFQSFYINQLYNRLFVQPAQTLAKIISSFFEPKIFEASLQLPENASFKTAKVLQAIQSGQIRSYIAWLVVGASLLIIYLSIESM